MQEWRTQDKSAWGAGPWQDEPDKAQWVDEATGLDCLIVRNYGGALCGYVGLPESHPLHGADYEKPNVDVHGGLTFADGCHEPTREGWEKMKAHFPSWEAEAAKYSHNPNSDAAVRVREYRPFLDDFDGYVAHLQPRSICHIPLAGRPDKVWWFGFDCAHSGDVSPSYASRYESMGYETYKDIGYVRAEVTSLAAQLAGHP